MVEDFKRALARVQTDYGFYIACQTDPAAALAGYDLSPDERATLVDPDKLTALLIRGVGSPALPRSISITISGTHDWVNRAAPPREEPRTTEPEAGVGARVEAIRQARTDDERTAAVVRLMELVG